MTTVQTNQNVEVVKTVNTDELVAILAIQPHTNGGNILVAEYQTDMLGKGKLRAAAKAAFPNGIFHAVRATLNVNYDYSKKYENRTGEEHVAVGNWQQAVIVGGRVTPLAVHKADVDHMTEQNTICYPGARFYLRYEPLTDAQKSSGFGKNDYSRYLDANGNEIAYETVKPYFFDREATPVEHRTLAIANVKTMKISGQYYHVSKVATPTAKVAQA